MMELFAAIEGRRSVRQFRSDLPVDDATLRQVLHAAIMAPSAGNGQCWRFVVVRDPELKRRLATDVGHQLFIEQAPVSIVVCADLKQASDKYGERGRALFVLQETAAAIENILLAVQALGLGSCWIGSFDETKASRALRLGEGLRPVAILPIGVPAEQAVRTPTRRKIEDVTDFR